TRLALVLIRTNPKGNVPRLRRQCIGRAVKENGAVMITSLAQSQLKMFFADNSGRSNRFDFSRKKQRLRISVAEWLEHFVPAEKIEIQFAKIDLVINLQSRLQIFIRQKLARDLPKLLGEKIDILLLNRQACRHFVTAVFVDLVGAATQRRNEIEAFDAATASFADTAFIKTNDDRRPMKFVRDPRCNDS